MSRREVTAQIDDITISADVMGQGPALLVLHGFTGDRTTMRALAEAFVSSYTVVVPDLVGHGASSAPDNEDAYQGAAMVEHLLALLAAALPDQGGTPVTLIGYSMGARLALTLAALRPDLVDRLILIGGTPGLRAQEATERAIADRALADAILTDGLDAFVDRWMALDMWTSLARALGPDGWMDSRAQRLRGSALGYANSLRGFGTGAMTPLHDHLADLHITTLIVVGEHDLKFRAIGDDMRRALPAATMVVIGDAGHAAHLEQPTATVAAIRRHLESE